MRVRASVVDGAGHSLLELYNIKTPMLPLSVSKWRGSYSFHRRHNRPGPEGGGIVCWRNRAQTKSPSLQALLLAQSDREHSVEYVLAPSPARALTCIGSLPYLQPPRPQTLECVTEGLSKHCPVCTSLPLGTRYLHSGSRVFHRPECDHTEILAWPGSLVWLWVCSRCLEGVYRTLRGESSCTPRGLMKGGL